MKKWIAPFLTLLFILSLVSVLGFFEDSRTAREKKEKAQIVLTQSREGGEKDTFMIDLLRQLKQMVDGWLKSINEEIEGEDVTRFKVRFLEILRSILEWVKGKIDAWLESSERDMREKGGLLREIHQKRSVASGLG
jgi:septum formation topological specificity factor MinE